MDNIEWIEADPLPQDCCSCTEWDCYNCDHAGERWRISRTDELQLCRKGLLKTIERLRQQIEKLDKEIGDLSEIG